MGTRVADARGFLCSCGEPIAPAEGYLQGICSRVCLGFCMQISRVQDRISLFLIEFFSVYFLTNKLIEYFMFFSVIV
eukprot:TRINITY_DN4403_c0_g1_i1.p1 TRINITY_DN4403_c0_g1~~TRINITY_DN4403_c0_g1_i1.p1  ORF type:complete len:77 (-),score=5.59 TRINITY_DN4403_c0_g1_i1:202-432(-)